MPPGPERDAAARRPGDVVGDDADWGDSGMPASAPDCNFSSEDSRECTMAREVEESRAIGLRVLSQPPLSSSSSSALSS